MRGTADVSFLDRTNGVASPERKKAVTLVVIRLRLTNPNNTGGWRDTHHRFQLFCNAAQSSGKEWKTVCVSGLPRTKTTTMKAIENIVSDL